MVLLVCFGLQRSWLWSTHFNDLYLPSKSINMSLLMWVFFTLPHLFVGLVIFLIFSDRFFIKVRVIFSYSFYAFFTISSQQVAQNFPYYSDPGSRLRDSCSRASSSSVEVLYIDVLPFRIVTYFGICVNWEKWVVFNLRLGIQWGMWTFEWTKLQGFYFQSY